MRLFLMIIIVVYAILNNIFRMPLERVSSDIFSYVWSAVILIKIAEIGYRHFTKREIKVFKWVDPFLALSPLFLFLSNWGKEE